MSATVTIKRIDGRTISKKVEYGASWEAFDESDHLIGYVDDLGEFGSMTLTFSPQPDAQGFTDSDLIAMREALRLAKVARRQEYGLKEQSNEDGNLHSHAHKFGRFDPAWTLANGETMVSGHRADRIDVGS